jgi:hypothetical protein
MAYVGVNALPSDWFTTCSGACRTCSQLEVQDNRFRMRGGVVVFSMDYHCRQHNGGAPHQKSACVGYEREPGSDDDFPAPAYEGLAVHRQPMPPVPEIKRGELPAAQLPRRETDPAEIERALSKAVLMGELDDDVCFVLRTPGLTAPS